MIRRRADSLQASSPGPPNSGQEKPSVLAEEAFRGSFGLALEVLSKTLGQKDFHRPQRPRKPHVRAQMAEIDTLLRVPESSQLGKNAGERVRFCVLLNIRKG